jgi:hypothetical protein
MTTMTTMIRAIGLLPLALSLVGCATGDDVTGAELDTLAQNVDEPNLPPPLPPIQIPTGETRGGLDDDRYPMPITDAPMRAELEMVSGRAARVPVSRAFTDQLTVTGAHHLRLRTEGCGATDDTGILATYVDGGPHTSVNDAHAAGGGNGKCSLIDLGARASTETYTVHVWSQNRATSTVHIKRDLGQGGGWTTWRTSEVVGGTLVSLGALASGDRVEVQTRSNGFDGVARSDTKLALFSVPSAYAGSGTDHVDQSVLTNDNQGTSAGITDRDPRIPIGAGWSTSRNYVLVSKVASGSAANVEVETEVDLVRGPEVADESLPFAGGVGTAETLAPGRYYLFLFAKQDRPPGTYEAALGTHHPAGAMPALDDGVDGTNGCPSVPRGDWGPESNWWRGQHNELAFTMWIERSLDGGATWLRVGPERPVLRGAMGALPGAPNRFALELTVPASAMYRLRAEAEVADVTFNEEWRYQRNPMATELKVATLNTYYAPHDYTGNEMRNLADLLATGTEIDLASRRVIADPDQVPFRWDVDVFGLQEAPKSGSGNYPDFAYTDVVRDEANARDSSAWEYVRGRDETWFNGLGDGPGLGPLYVRSSVWPGATDMSMYFSDAAAAPGPNGGGGCTRLSTITPFPGVIDPTLDDRYMECHLDEDGADGDLVNYMTPGKIEAWRGGSDDRPIAVYNAHLEASDGAADFNARWGEVTDMIATIKDQLAVDPQAFNRAGSPTADFWQNRMIIVMDGNMRVHECGEHYWMLRRLREEFGYAVDVAMATPDLDGAATLGMHTNDAGYFGAWPIAFQDGSFTAAGLAPVQGWDDEAATFGSLNYTDTSRYPVTADHRSNALYPWWAATGREKMAFGGNTERYDMIFLVGRGWAYDDPVLQYAVMSDKNANDHNAGSRLDDTGFGVEMWRPDDCNAGGVLDEGAAGFIAGTSYQPDWDLGCGTAPGKPAMHTDHRPVGARLRVWVR